LTQYLTPGRAKSSLLGIVDALSRPLPSALVCFAAPAITHKGPRAETALWWHAAAASR
jgi:hypothetical protein